MTKTTLRLAFAGTPELARIVLESLLQKNDHRVEIVFTQPDRPAGRGRKLKQSAVKQCALDNHLLLLQPTTMNEFQIEWLNNCDVVLVVAYGLLIPPKILVKPKQGCINIHASLLPRWRGATPIQRAIEAGDNESGISIMQIDPGLDTGPLLEQIRCPIHDHDTAATLHDRIAKISADSINAVLDKIANNDIHKTPQNDSLHTHANKITRQDGKMDWAKSAIELERKIRAFNPFPVAHTVLNDIPMRIWTAEVKSDLTRVTPGTILKGRSTIDIVTGNGVLRITKLQLPGKKIITAKDFLNAHPAFLSQGTYNLT